MEFKSVALPTYLRKQREKELDEANNFFDKAVLSTKLQGSPDITDFILQVQAKAEEEKRKREEAEANEEDDAKLRKKRE